MMAQGRRLLALLAKTALQEQIGVHTAKAANDAAAMERAMQRAKFAREAAMLEFQRQGLEVQQGQLQVSKDTLTQRQTESSEEMKFKREQATAEQGFREREVAVKEAGIDKTLLDKIQELREALGEEPSDEQKGLLLFGSAYAQLQKKLTDKQSISEKITEVEQALGRSLDASEREYIAFGKKNAPQTLTQKIRDAEVALGRELTENERIGVILGSAFARSPKMTQSEKTDALFASRMGISLPILESTEGDSDTLGILTNPSPLSRRNLGRIKPETLKRYEAAKRDFVNAVLRRESGAVIADDEFKNAEKQYFAQPGDTPAVIAQKKSLRRAVFTGLGGDESLLIGGSGDDGTTDSATSITLDDLLRRGQIAKTTGILDQFFDYLENAEGVTPEMIQQLHTLLDDEESEAR